MKNSEDKAECATIINGVVLTDHAINYLKGLQQDDNAIIKDVRDELNNVISELLDATDYVGEESVLVINELIKFINTFNKNLKYLMKP